MRVMPLSEIIIPEDRQRTTIDPEHIKALASSISTMFLMHPPVVRNDGRTLIAGECRIRAIQMLAEQQKAFLCGDVIIKPGMCPVTPASELTPLELEEAELEENIRRSELTWADRVRATEKLAHLRTEQSPTKTPPTHTSLADQLREMTRTPVATQDISPMLALAKHLDDPEISSAKTQKEALKILRKKKETEKRKQLADAFEASPIAKKAFPHNLIVGDSLAKAKALPNSTYSCIITDPPYGVGADTFGDQADARHEYEDTFEQALIHYQSVAVEGFRVAAARAHLYAFCDIRHFYTLVPLFEAAGWYVWNRPLIWYKGSNSGMLPQPDHAPRNTYEAIIFARKGDKKVNHVAPDVIQCASLSRPVFGAQKPIAIYKDLLSRSTDPGDQILDFYCGAGPAFFAARLLMLTCTGIESNQEKIDYILSEYLNEGDNDEES